MTQPLRLIAQLIEDTAAGSTVQFLAAFPAPDPDLPGPVCAPARLETGDGTTLTLGILCPPGAVNWTDGGVELAAHTYADPNLANQARLLWGDQTIPAEEMGGRAVAPNVQLSTFLVQPDPSAMQVRVKVKVAGLEDGHQVRVDAGRGQRGTIQAGADGAESHEWIFGFPKPGDYAVTVDLLDEDGFAVLRLGESPVQMAEPMDFPKSVPATKRLPLGADIPAGPDEGGVVARLPQAGEAGADLAEGLESSTRSGQPWLPFRYAYPLWSWVTTYTAAGGSRVSRTLAPGTYLAIRAESYVGGHLWYQTGSYDWVPASSVGLFVTSDLRGVELGVTPAPDPQPDPVPPPAPDPVPDPDPQPIKRGVVTANRLNVRARPGAGSGNPPIDQVTLNTDLEIFEELSASGAIWYRIGPGPNRDRWVHSSWVRITETVVPTPTPTPDPVPDPVPDPDPQPLKRGQVIIDRLNVRAQPGTRAGNPPIDQITRATIVEVWAEQSYLGHIWFRIGPGPNRDRWVHSGYIEILASSRAVQSQAVPVTPVTPRIDTGPISLPLGWVTSNRLNVRGVPGVSAGNPPVDQLNQYDRVPILETRTVAGASWYRIGTNRWVYGSYVGVARPRSRPSGIGAGERWVSVCLSEQTLVAYEGDTPVYACLVATGLPGTPTVQGTFRTHWRVASRRMTGGVPGTSDYYYLEEVTWTCYFYGGYALHTAYWHDAFGSPRSHGCVNMSPYDCWWIFQWSGAGGAKSPAVHVYWA